MYGIVSCSQSGFFESEDLYGQLPSSAQATFVLSQTADIVTGMFWLGTLEFSPMTATIAPDGGAEITGMLDVEETQELRTFSDDGAEIVPSSRDRGR